MNTRGAGARPDPDDPQRDAVYAAEDAVIGSIGPRLTRWRDVEAFVESVLGLGAYLDRWPDAPLDVQLLRRSRSSTASLAFAGRDAIVIRDGSWNALTILHELAHLVVAAETRAGRIGSPDARAPHGPVFVTVELELVRMRCGFDQYGSLLTSFERHGVRRAG